jgi:hypothetical protein
MSVASAYAFRNRRQGRSFAKMWDAILIHRARVHIAAENSARPVNGVASKSVRDPASHGRGGRGGRPG